jgi:hypothetical protein
LGQLLNFISEKNVIMQLAPEVTASVPRKGVRKTVFWEKSGPTNTPPAKIQESTPTNTGFRQLRELTNYADRGVMRFIHYGCDISKASKKCPNIAEYAYFTQN